MKKKRIAGIGLVLLVILAFCGGIFFMMGSSEEITLTENQKYIYGYITSIQGNEMTYVEIEESVIEAMLETETESTQKETARTESSEKEEMLTESEDISDRENDDMGNMPGRGEMSDMGNMSRGEAFDMEMTSAVTVYIPVGVTVHTAADVATTFSRLASGDLVKILVETTKDGQDVIEEIWMLQ